MFLARTGTTGTPSDIVVCLDALGEEQEEFAWLGTRRVSSTARHCWALFASTVGLQVCWLALLTLCGTPNSPKGRRRRRHRKREDWRETHSSRPIAGLHPLVRFQGSSCFLRGRVVTRRDASALSEVWIGAVHGRHVRGPRPVGRGCGCSPVEFDGLFVQVRRWRTQLEDGKGKERKERRGLDIKLGVFFPRRRGRVVRGRPCCMNYELRKVHQLPVLSIRRKSGPRGAVSSNPALKDWIARRNQSGRSPGFSMRGWADRNARAKTLQRSDGYSLSLFVFHPPDSSLPMQPPFGREVVRPWIKASSRPSQFATKKEVGLGEWPP